MVPRIVRPTDGSFDLDYDKPKSIGACAASRATTGTFVRSYAYIRSLGAEGLQERVGDAVLNANYLLARLQRGGVAELLPLAYGKLCGTSSACRARR
jgi:glycine dehydrogenase subunit 2